MHHHGEADCRNDVEGGHAEGRDKEPRPQHAQSEAIEDGADERQNPNADVFNDNREHGHLLSPQDIVLSRFSRGGLLDTTSNSRLT